MAGTFNGIYWSKNSEFLSDSVISSNFTYKPIQYGIVPENNSWLFNTYRINNMPIGNGYKLTFKLNAINDSNKPFNEIVINKRYLTNRYYFY